jgi:hypothetical protein
MEKPHAFWPHLSFVYLAATGANSCGVLGGRVGTPRRGSAIMLPVWSDL